MSLQISKRWRDDLSPAEIISSMFLSTTSFRIHTSSQFPTCDRVVGGGLLSDSDNAYILLNPRLQTQTHRSHVQTRSAFSEELRYPPTVLVVWFESQMSITIANGKVPTIHASCCFKSARENVGRQNSLENDHTREKKPWSMSRLR